jgi:hypothetical protein
VREVGVRRLVSVVGDLEATLGPDDATPDDARRRRRTTTTDQTTPLSSQTQTRSAETVGSRLRSAVKGVAEFLR